LATNNNELAIKLKAISNGDKKAFEELYRDLNTPIFTIIYRVTWDMTMSEDILQEVFLKLFLLLPSPLIKNPRAYIFQMARNLAIDSKRKQLQNISLDEIADTLSHPIDGLSMRVDVDDALKSLPTQECEIVNLHIIGGMKFREISDLLKIPLGTVLWKYQKAIGKLQKIIIGGSS